MQVAVNLAKWQQRWARVFARVLDLHVETIGLPPTDGFLLSNHVSYLDIAALATTGPMTFVSKADVRKWPVFGLLARCAGTIFVQRERKLDVEWVNERIASLAQRGALICLFPEGTSSNGRHVLPFRSSLLEPAINKPVCPVWIRYETDEGSVGRDVAYWGDAVFALHLWRFLRLKRTRVYVHFASPMIRSDRKQIANDCWAQISELSRKTSTQPLEEIDHDLAISA